MVESIDLGMVREDGEVANILLKGGVDEKRRGERGKLVEQRKGKLKDILEGKIGDGGKREEKNNRIGDYYSIKSINTFNFY